MPLVERYNDWKIKDGSHDDPHTLDFDHRINANGPAFDEAKAYSGLSGAEANVQATCIITSLSPNDGWTDVGNGEWIYEPWTRRAQSVPTLGVHFEQNLRSCIEHDQKNLLNTLTRDMGSSRNATDDGVIEAIKAIEWPADGCDDRRPTSYVSRFPLEDQYIAGEEYASGYHLGNGIVGTAGHCLVTALLKNELHHLKVVFGWCGDVRGKRFTASQVFGIEKVILCDAPSDYKDAEDLEGIANWARRWDNAVFQLKGTSEKFDSLERAKLATQPPRFGTPVYNAGHSLGTPMKISWRSHVLRHAIFDGDGSPFSHAINPHGTYSTDLDQFPGNSGGPVFDGTTGNIVGHTVSTQSAVSEATRSDIRSWEETFLIDSSNYNLTERTINPYLAQKRPNDPDYRIHPKFYRTLSGNPHGGALFQNTTFICPDDLGPNHVRLQDDSYQAVFNRHRWDSRDVVFRNLTGRIDRVVIFTRPLASIIQDFPGSTLVINIIGQVGHFQEPKPDSNAFITVGTAEWKIPLGILKMEANLTVGSVTYRSTINLSAIANEGMIPLDCLKTPTGLAKWSKFRLEQATHNPPISIELDVIIRKARFSFPVDQSWPPDRPDVTKNPEDQNMEWPAEDFHISTTVGTNVGATQKDNIQPPAPSMTTNGGAFGWEALIDRVWANPNQPNTRYTAAPGLALLDPSMGLRAEQR